MLSHMHPGFQIVSHQIFLPKCCIHSFPMAVMRPSHFVLDFNISVMKLAIMHFCYIIYFIHLQLKYFSQHSVLKYPQSVYVFLLNVRHQVLHPYKTTGKIMVLHILVFWGDGRTTDEKTECYDLIHSKHNLTVTCP
jgi:hypothetical protein